MPDGVGKPWFNASKFIDILDKIYSGIGPVQREKIKQAIKKAYNLPDEFKDIEDRVGDSTDEY